MSGECEGEFGGGVGAITESRGGRVVGNGHERVGASSIILGKPVRFARHHQYEYEGDGGA